MGLLLIPILPLLLLALLPLRTVENVRVNPGVSLEQSKQIDFEILDWKGTPVTPAWYTLLSRAKRAGWKGSTNGPISGVRGYQDQKRLYDLWRSGKGAPAFPPNGPSRHLLRNIRYWGQWSQASDVSYPEQLIRISKRLGVSLRAPYDPEPWHVEALYAFSLPDQTSVSTKKEPLVPLRLPVSLLLFLGGAYALNRRRSSRDHGHDQ